MNQLEMMGQIMGIRNAQQEQAARAQQMQTGAIEQQGAQLQLQQQQQAMKDQQAMTQAYQKWDGRDYTDLAHLALQSGATGDVVQNLLQHGLTVRKTLSDIASQDATTGSKNLETLKNQYGMITGGLQSVLSVPDEQMPQKLLDLAQQLGQEKRPDGSPLLDQQHMQIAQQLAQQGPQAIKNALPLMQKDFISLNDQLDQAQKRAELAGKQLANKVEEQQVAYGGNQQLADAKYRFIQQRQASGIAPSPDEQAFVKAYQKQKLLVPQATAQVRIEGMQQSREYPVFDNQTKSTIMMNAADLNEANKVQPGRFTVPGYTPEALGEKGTTEYFTKGKGGQQITAFNTAIKHLDTLNILAHDLNNSNLQVFNKAAQTWKEQTGNPAPSNFAAAKNAMAGEVAAALKASGATDQEISNVGQTFDKMQSPAQLKVAIRTYRTLLQSKVDQLHGQYQQGMQGKPNFSGETSALQEGATRVNSHGDKVVFRGGKWQLAQ